jgi:hypothetical protein
MDTVQNCGPQFCAHCEKADMDAFGLTTVLDTSKYISYPIPIVVELSIIA